MYEYVFRIRVQNYTLFWIFNYLFYNYFQFLGRSHFIWGLSLYLFFRLGFLKNLAYQNRKTLINI
jgi:hypothetical protein